MTQVSSRPAGSTPEVALLPNRDDLSVVLQGSLYDSNIVETAMRCEHWRRLFPRAQIVFAIALTEILRARRDENGLLHEIGLTPAYEHHGLYQAALARLIAATDRIVLSSGALPLPPIKFDAKTNNVNLQIAAAKAGLAHATGTYTLRIRSDIVFATDRFLQHYSLNYSLERRASAAFRQRVMISPYFTLNPYTMERLPFHFSDWFHFGLTEDIRKIWAVDEMSLFDSTFYNRNKHEPHSNAFERKFRTRLAVEQYISSEYLSRYYPSIALDYVNDPRSADLSMDILLGEFLIADMHAIDVLFDKYQSVFTDKNMELLCVTHGQWRHLNTLGGAIDYRAHYASAARKADFLIRLREDPLMRPLRLAINIYKQVRRKARWLAARVVSICASGQREARHRPVQPARESAPPHSSRPVDGDAPSGARLENAS